MPDIKERREILRNALRLKRNSRVDLDIEPTDRLSILKATLSFPTFPGLRHERPHLKFVDAQNPSRQKPR